MRKIFSVIVLLIILILFSSLRGEEIVTLDRQIEHIKIMQGSDKPICVFGGGVGTRWDDALIAGEDLYGGPAIGIHAYTGDVIPDIFRAAIDYLDPQQGKETGRRVLRDLEKIYQKCGRIDMATFHSAFVVALNNIPEELDVLLSSGKLRFGKLALAGADVQPKLADVLNKHQKKGNIKDWVALEKSYIPGKQRGDLVVFVTTPNWEFKSYLGAILAKAFVAVELAILKIPSLVSGGKFGGGAMFYDFSPDHFMETYTPAAHKFFVIAGKTGKSDKLPESKIGREEEKKYKKDEKYPPWWPPPPDKNLPAAGKPPGGVLLEKGNFYITDNTGALKKLEKDALKSRPEKGIITWNLEHEGKKYKAVAIPSGKKNTGSVETNFYYDNRQKTVVFCRGDEVVAFKLYPSGPYLQILQIVEGKVIEKKNNSIVFQTTNIVFSDYQ